MIGKIGQGDGFFVISGLTAGQETGNDVKFLDIGCLAKIVDFDQEAEGLLHIRVQGHVLVELENAQQNQSGQWQADCIETNYQQEDIEPDFATQMVKLYDTVVEHPFLKRRNLKIDANDSEQVINFLCMWLPMSFDARTRIMRTVSSHKKATQIMIELDAIQQDLERANLGTDGQGLSDLTPH